MGNPLNKILFLIGAISLILAGYFIYQTRQLQNRLATIESSQLPSPVEPTSTPADETTNWKTYSNTKLGFSFKYPSDWEAQPANIYGSRSTSEFKYQNTPLFTFSNIANYNQTTGKPYTSLDEYLDNRINSSRDAQISGLPAKVVSNSGGEHAIAYQEALVFSPDQKAIVSLYFSWPYYSQDLAKSTAILDQILSTFKFL